MTVYEMRTYTVQVGKMPEAIRLYSQFGYPALHKGGFDKKLVGYFISDTGTLVSPQKSVAESPSVAGCHEGGKRAY
jgi:hypothetical protein